MLGLRRCCCGTSTGYPCGSCSIPKANLTLSWTNPIIGPGSAILAYSAVPTKWESACTDELIFQLSCLAGVPTLKAIYFLSGVCPAGVRSDCHNGGAAGHQLTQTSLTCGSSYLQTFNVTNLGCPTLFAAGYTSFTVSA